MPDPVETPVASTTQGDLGSQPGGKARPDSGGARIPEWSSLP